MPQEPMLITSAGNERLKHARRVRDGHERDLIFVEGERLVEECVRSGLPVEMVLHTPEPTDRSRAVLAALTGRQPSVSVFAVEPRVLAGLGDTVTTQGLIALAKRPERQLVQTMEASPRLLVGLDRVQDPGNFGTLVRTAEAAGTSGVVALEGSADAFSPKTLRSAMGSAFRLPIITGQNAAEVVAHCRQYGLCLAAAAGSGEMSYYDYDWRQPTMLWLGNEARGVQPALLELCDVRLHIPLHAGVESLNVAAAGSAMLFEAVRQRRSPGSK